MTTADSDDRLDSASEDEAATGDCCGSGGEGGGWRCQMESIRRSKRMLIASVFMVLMFDSILLTAVGKQIGLRKPVYIPALHQIKSAKADLHVHSGIGINKVTCTWDVA